ncbi:hypothetical protein [Erwinia phage FBB1]|nr:hypothetical protein [Erwinia phage FBB1]
MKQYSWSEYQLKYSRSYKFSYKTSCRIDLYSLLFFIVLTCVCPFGLIHFYTVCNISPTLLHVSALFLSMVIPLALALVAIDDNISKIVERVWYKPLKIYDNRSSKKYKEQLKKIENDKKNQRELEQSRLNAECWVKQLRENSDV